MLTENDIALALDESLFLHEEKGYRLFYTPLTRKFEIVNPYGESLHHAVIPIKVAVKLFNTYIS